MVNWMIVALIAAMLFVMLLIVSIKVFGHEYDWIAALGAAFCGATTLVILLVAISSVSSDGIGFFFKILFSGILVGAIVDIRGFLYHFFNEFAVTNKKVVAKTGIIKTKELSSPLKQIQNVQVATGFWGKIFKYGTVNVTTASGLYSIKYVNDPQGFRNSIMAQIENAEEDKMDLHAHKIASAIHNLEN